jgi:hypothetical protein
MWETIKDTLAQLVDRVGVLLILLGFILLILAAAGGVRYNGVLAINDPLAQQLSKSSVSFCLQSAYSYL